MNGLPLVSILIPNYNYGRYLRQCFDSVIAQTYSNIEVIFRDNNSTDDSFEIAMEYYPRFKEKGIYFSIHKNKYNVGSDRNSDLCVNDSQGDFTYVLASDDSIEPTFIEKCVSVFRKYPNVSMVMTHRKEIDQFGNITESVPFYNKSCIVPGEDQAAVFMMAGIAIPAQRICKIECLRKTRQFKRNWNVAGDWYVNFRAAMGGDIAYINEPLVKYRVHIGNETSVSEQNLLGIFEHYQLLHEFKDMSLNFGMQKPAARMNEAVEKLGNMCLRYALKMLKCKSRGAAQKYLMLAPVLKESIIQDERYKMLYSYIDLKDAELEAALVEFEGKNNLNRAVSYEPPEGSFSLIL